MAAVSPYQGEELHLHPQTGVEVRVFDIVVKIEDPLNYLPANKEVLPNEWERFCRSDFDANYHDTQWHPRGRCFVAYIEKSFRELARRLYEATNGKHLLGKVRFISNINEQYADIVWRGSGLLEEGQRILQSNASTGNWRRRDSQAGIEMYRRNKWGAPELFSPEKEGAEMMHEWGHYVFGLPDEYYTTASLSSKCPRVECWEVAYRPFLKENRGVTLPASGISERGWLALWDTSNVGQKVGQSLWDSWEALRGRANDIPSLMNNHWGGTPEGDLRFANLSTPMNYCVERLHLSNTREYDSVSCTHQFFEDSLLRVQFKPNDQYPSAWAYIVRPGWAESSLSNREPFRWPELANAAPRETDKDCKGYKYVKIEDAPPEITEAFLELNWDHWEMNEIGERSILLLIDASGSGDTASYKSKLFQDIEALLDLLEDSKHASLRIGLRAFALGSTDVPVSNVYVPVQPVATAIPAIRQALSQINFKGLGFWGGYLSDAAYYLQGEAAERKKEIVFYTDGNLWYGGSPFYDIINMLKTKNISLHLQLAPTYRINRDQEMLSRVARRLDGSTAYRYPSIRYSGEAVKLLQQKILQEKMLSTSKSGNAYEIKMDDHCYSDLKLLFYSRAGVANNSVKMEYDLVGTKNWQELPLECDTIPGPLALFSCRLKKSDCLAAKGTSDTFYLRFYTTQTVEDGYKDFFILRRDRDRESDPSIFLSAVNWGEQGGESQYDPKLFHLSVGTPELRLSAPRLQAEICELEQDDQPCEIVEFRDDGTDADKMAGDGLFALRWDRFAPLTPYSVRVRLDTLPSSSFWVSPQGNEVPEKTPHISGLFAVEHLLAAVDSLDDHRDTLSVGTLLDSGVTQQGRISHIGDIDCFRFSSNRAERSVVRVTGQLDDFSLRATLYDHDETALFQRVKEGSEGVHSLSIILPPYAGAGLCLEATDGKTLGNYSIYFGERKGWDYPQQLNLRVEAKDHHWGHPQISVLSLRLFNQGDEPLINGALHYFFTMPEATPHLLDYYTPESSAELVDHGDGEYEMVITLENWLLPLESHPKGLENQLHLRGENYETLNKMDDWSNPQSVLFKTTDRVVVTDGRGEVVYGTAPEWWLLKREVQ